MVVTSTSLGQGRQRFARLNTTRVYYLIVTKVAC